MIGPLPSSQQPIGQVRQDGNVLITPVWQRWFNSFLQAPPAPSAATLSASPASLTAQAPGSFLVTGGTVSVISIQRGTATLVTGQTSGFIPVAVADRIVITYSVLPAVQFLPS